MLILVVSISSVGPLPSLFSPLFSPVCCVVFVVVQSHGSMHALHSPASLLLPSTPPSFFCSIVIPLYTHLLPLVTFLDSTFCLRFMFAECVYGLWFYGTVHYDCVAFSFYPSILTSLPRLLLTPTPPDYNLYLSTYLLTPYRTPFVVLSYV